MAESNNSEQSSVAGAQKDDAELDSLLDSALDDFTELSKERPAEKKVEENKTPKEGEVEEVWADMLKQALQTDPNISRMFEQGNVDENAFVQDFSKMAEAAAKVIESNTSNNFADIMTETLRNLNESSETLQNRFGNPEDMASLFEELGLNGGMDRPDGNFEDMPPFMQSIMQSFLSKDILYPSMKEFIEKYPAWLDEHKDTLTPEEYDNYSKQLELMKKVVEEFEAESDSDSDEVKKKRFQRIMEYMQQMQTLGQPPADLIGSEVPFDVSALSSNLPPGVDPSQCCVM